MGAPELVRRQKSKGRAGAHTLIVVSGGRPRRAKYADLGLASLSHFGGVWAFRVVPSPWYLALGTTGARGILAWHVSIKGGGWEQLLI